LTFRLFDVVFAEGLDCLVRVALAVLKRSQTRLLSLEFEAILQYLNDGPLFAFYSHAAPDMLVRDANQITSVNARYLERLRRQYIDEMQRRMEEEDEGHRVRAENDKLHDECSRLRAALEDVTSAHDGVLSERTAAQTQLGKQRDECARLQQRVADLEEAQRQAAQEPAAAAELQADVDRLAEKNVQLTIKNQQLEDSLQDLEEALIQIKTLYADCENDRALMTKKFEDLKRALS
ncbi:GTPase-activating protein, partial [Coemansia nantahalensis]